MEAFDVAIQYLLAMGLGPTLDSVIDAEAERTREVNTRSGDSSTGAMARIDSDNHVVVSVS